MNTQHGQTLASFVRNSNYPLEADYIFESEELLKKWEEDHRKYLHEGLFKVVVLEDKQVLYWYDHNTFKPILESDTLEQLAMVLKDFELHGQLRDLIRDFQNAYDSKLKAYQQELDQTQSGAGLNADGSFDALNMKNTTYLDGATSIVECLKALDREMSNLVVDAFIQDAYYDSEDESVVLTFITKQEKTKTIRIKLTNLIREWEPDNSFPTKVVELTREEVYGGGADKLSADVRISDNQYNILRKDGNTLLVKGTSDNILHGEGTVKEELNSIREDMEKIAFPDPFVFNSYNQAIRADLKPGATFYLKSDDEVILPDQTEPTLFRRGMYAVDDAGNFELLSLDVVLETRLKELTSRVDVNTGEILGNKALILTVQDTANNAFAKANEAKALHEGQYNALVPRVDKNEGEIAGAIALLDVHREQIDAHTKRITDNEREISNLQNPRVFESIVKNGDLSKGVFYIYNNSQSGYNESNRKHITYTELVKSIDSDVTHTFTPISPDTLKVPTTIGDIQKGTTAADLKGKSISEILDSILFPTIYPSITEPSVTITSTPVSSIVEAGSILITDISYTFNRGKVKVDDGSTPDKNYAGVDTGHSYSIQIQGGANNTQAGVTAYPTKTETDIANITRYEPGTYSYKVIVACAEGDLMSTSKGATPNPINTTTMGLRDNPRKPGNVQSTASLVRKVTLPVFIDVADGTYVRQSLKEWGAMTFSGVVMQGTSKDDPIKIKTPRKLNSVNSYNEVSGKYDVAQLANFVMTTITENINGADYTYYEYVWNGGAQAAVNMEIKTY